MRPSQWVKNCLIVVAPAAAGTLTHGAVLLHTVIAFLAFCAVSSAVYLLNDVQDREADRRHPTKRYRAIASGRLQQPPPSVPRSYSSCSDSSSPLRSVVPANS